MKRIRMSCKACRKKRLAAAALVLCGVVLVKWLHVTEILKADGQKRESLARSSHRELKLTVRQQAAATRSEQQPPTMGDVVQDAVYVQRRQQSQGVCGEVGEGRVSLWTRYNGTAYCILPKVGSTFWKSVFRILHGDAGGRYSSPFQIPRIYVHTGPRKSMRFYRNWEAGYLKDDFRFLFVRDPYSRLFSAYVDKLLLPDFWKAVGRLIARQRPDKSNAHCGSDVSFQEFLELVVSRRPVPCRNHWNPVHSLCSPCLFQPHVIGKMETFLQDVRYILRVMNSSWMLDSHSPYQHVLQELDLITKYNFVIWRRNRNVRSCVSRLQLCRLLWRAFQINGYLPSDKPFPENLDSKISAKEFTVVVQEVYRQAAKNASSQLELQKKQMMLDAYRAVRTHTLEKLKRMYRYDFLLFNYDPEPAGIFQYRKGP